MSSPRTWDRNEASCRGLAARLPRHCLPAGDGGAHLYSNVGADPINRIDPTGMQEICWNVDATYAVDGLITVTTRKVCGNFDGGGGFSDGGRGVERTIGSILGGIGDALDDLADDYLKPPEPRQEEESFEECLARVTNPEIAGAGAAGVRAGMADKSLYPRTPFAGASGTSYISRFTRWIFGILGIDKRGSYPFGAKTRGGAVGRGLSRGSVAVGAAAVGYEGGEALGAAQICR